MALFDDYIIATSAAVITAAVIILSVLLVRYRQAAEDANKSAQLAKNVWDSMNGRLSTMDARIIDLMAKVDVYSTQAASRKTVSLPDRRQVPSPLQAEPSQTQPLQQRQPVPPPAAIIAPGPPATEVQILQLLTQGAKTANQIREVVPKTREHMARVMRTLFERGLVTRNDQNKPYVYEISEAGRRYLAGT